MKGFIVEHRTESLCAPYLGQFYDFEFEIEFFRVKRTLIQGEQGLDVGKMPYPVEYHADKLLDKYPDKNSLTFVIVHADNLMNALNIISAGESTDEMSDGIGMDFFKSSLLDYCNRNNITGDPIVCVYDTNDSDKPICDITNTVNRICEFLESHNFVNRTYPSVSDRIMRYYEFPSLRTQIKRAAVTARLMSIGDPVKGINYAVADLIRSLPGVVN